MKGKDGKSGFLYLKNEIVPTATQTRWIGIVAFLACMGLWIWAAAHYDPSEGRMTFRSIYLDWKHKRKQGVKS